MPLNSPKPTQQAYELVPSGNHVARVYRVLHLGTLSEMYMGEKKMNDKVMIGFELLNEKKVFRQDKGEEPFVVSREYTLSMASKANLRKLIEGMFGVALQDGEANSFDIFGIIGQPCLVNVIHQDSKNGKRYSIVTGASPIPKGIPVPEGHNKAQKMGFGEDWNEELFVSLPNFIKDKIASSPEFKKMRAGETGYPEDEIDPQDIPF